MKPRQPQDGARGGAGSPWVVWLLSGIAGYVDTAGCLALYGLFPSHVTGDLVSVGALTSDHSKAGVFARLAMLPLFMVAVALTAVVARRARARLQDPLPRLYAMMTLGMAVFGASGTLLASRAHGPDAASVVVVGGAAVVSMGIQNALMRECLSGLLPTTVMTGNLTQFTIGLVELCSVTRGSDAGERARERRLLRDRLRHVGAPLCGFLVGVALAGYLTGRIGLASVFVPVLATLSLTCVAFRNARAEWLPPSSSGVWRRIDAVIPSDLEVPVRITPRHNHKTGS